MDNSKILNVSLERAYRFLRECQSVNGAWSDFLTLAGESVFWVSGYVGHALSAGKNTKSSLFAAHTARMLLNNQDKEGGWSYGPLVPPDADSTSWCVRFLSSIEMLNPKIKDLAVGYLLRHQNEDGGFRTYGNPNRIARFMGLNGSITFEGWCSSQICVTAVAVQTLLENQFYSEAARGLHFIEKSQDNDGFWSPYWWSERLYSTYHCMEAVHKGRGLNSALIDRSQDWITRNQHPDGSWGDHDHKGVPFSTALALRGLMVGQKSEFHDFIESGFEWLFSHQRDDGSWGPDYILRIPHPACTEPWTQASWIEDGKAVNAVIKDHNCIFSTATVISALSEFGEIASRNKGK